MKNIYILSALLWLVSLSFGQPANNQTSFGGIHYQTVVRNSEGLPLQNTAITLLMTIRANAPDGEAAYSETHTATTNQFGLVNLVIGQGTPVTGEFPAINWGAAPHFLETALDAYGGGQFQVMGVTQFLSVPYALNSLNGMPAGENPGDMLYWDGSQWIQIGVGQNGQALILQNGIPTWGGVQLPILNTSAVTNITAFTAYSGGNIASDGGSPIVGRGICWNTSPNPTTGNFKVFAGSGAGNFLAQMTGLESSTQYFVRAFATNSAGTSYGQEMTFYTTAGNITLSTTAITDITTSTATSGGNIVLNGGSPVIARGVCWNTAPYPTTAHNKTTDGTGNGTFVSQLTGLANNTQYYVRAYATNSLGTSYGNQLTFTTLSGIVTLTTAEVTGITSSSAISGGEITTDGGSAVTARGVCWNTAPYPTLSNNKTTDGTGNGTFVSQLTGLTNNTTYYVRAYATNSLGTSYGNPLTFTTLSGIVTLITAEVNGITSNSAISGGEITSDGGSPVTARGVCWNTSPNPTTANSFTTDGTGTSTFVSTLTGLTEGTTYYVRAYATNAFGTYYGEEANFETLPWQCGSPILDERDGQIYITVQIGEQCWMAENLNVGTMIDGNQNQQNNGNIDKYCYGNLLADCDVYGGLYQWNEMMQYSTTSGANGICPVGWHIQSDAEWTNLTTYLGGQSVAGGKMKETGTTHWLSPNLDATNSSGFTGLPGGGHTPIGGTFYNLGSISYFWSSSEDSVPIAWDGNLYSWGANVDHGSSPKVLGFSVRCLSDFY